MCVRPSVGRRTCRTPSRTTSDRCSPLLAPSTNSTSSPKWLSTFSILPLKETSSSYTLVICCTQIVFVKLSWINPRVVLLYFQIQTTEQSLDEREDVQNLKVIKSVDDYPVRRIQRRLHVSKEHGGARWEIVLSDAEAHWVLSSYLFYDAYGPVLPAPSAFPIEFIICPDPLRANRTLSRVLHP